MKLRWLLPPLALASLAGVVWITSHGGKRSPEALLESARDELEADPPDNAGARRDLDEALEHMDSARALAKTETAEQNELRAALLDLRAQVYADDGLDELALADCRTRLEECGARTDTLALASDLCLGLGEPGLALEHAEHLAALDPARGLNRVGRCRVALADLPLAALARLATSSLLPSLASRATTLGQRAAVFADDEIESSAALDEALELFSRADERRKAGEWVHEASEHMRAARAAFVASLAPGSSGEAAAGLQDLLLRGGAQREAADLGTVALSIPDLAHPMPVLARTASALAALGRTGSARALILDEEKRARNALLPDDLPSLALRDELEEWCELLRDLGLWDELGKAGLVFCGRAQAGDDPPKMHRAWLLTATAEMRLGQLGAAQKVIEGVDPTVLGERDSAAKVWLRRAELARLQGERSQERYALLLVTSTAPLDPPPPLRSELGRAWQRLSELQKEEGNQAAAEISLTHALRCSSERVAEVLPLWEEIGRKAQASRGTGSPYLLYQRAKNQDAVGQADLALTDARALLKDYPGLGPALEIVSRAANKLRDYPLMISASLELMERGWPGAGASARLRGVPREFFLPQDRVRWMLFDPRGSLEAVVRNLLAKGDVSGAAMAARGGPARYQPVELLPLLARVELDAGEPAVAEDTLELVPPGEVLRGCTALALRIALQRDQVTKKAGKLPAAVARVIASGAAEDPELPAALDALLAHGHTQESADLLAWLEPQSPPFLDEVLLRQTATRLVAGTSAAVDPDLERAAALLDDGRPELGRLLLALASDDEETLADEARSVLKTPFASTPARRAALSFLQDDPGAAEALGAPARDGRECLPALLQACLAADAPEGATDAPLAPLSPALLEALPARALVVLALAAEVAPWSSWTLVRLHALEPSLRKDPWARVLSAQAWLALGWPARAIGEVGWPHAGEPAVLAWMRVRALRAANAETEDERAGELAWFEASGITAEEDPSLAPLEAERAARAGQREDAVRTLETALEKVPGDPAPLAALAELENTSGRRTRAIELASRAFTLQPGAAGAERVPAFLDLLRAARDAGEITDERWWAEVEALEAERPEDPAPVRELAARAFERAGAEGATGRSPGLERLERFRARTLDRSLEALRPGETERWVQLLASYMPERAVTFAEEELLRDPSDPVLWRASARALLAADRTASALERLDALQKVAPDAETGRLLALTGFQMDNDPERFEKRLAEIERLFPELEKDPVLAFYGGLLAEGKGRFEGLQKALELWRARAENGLGEAEHGRTLALGLFYAGRRGPALNALGETRSLSKSSLQSDVLQALAYLMKNAPAAPHRLEDAPPPPAPSADDAPAQASKEKGAGVAADAAKKAPGKKAKLPASQTDDSEPPAAGAKPGAKGGAKPGAKPGAKGNSGADEKSNAGDGARAKAKAKAGGAKPGAKTPKGGAKGGAKPEEPK